MSSFIPTSEIIEIEGNITPDTIIPDEGHILVISKDQSYLTHGIHKFPAKFFPELPRYLIQMYSKPGQLVLDPMCGSGTVILEAMLNERIGIGVDIDPIAQLITKSKTTPLDVDSLILVQDWIVSTTLERLNSDEYFPNIPMFYYRDNWFQQHVLHELGIIHDTIDDVLQSQINELIHFEEMKNIVDFFRVVFSSIIRDVSNADPHCTRTVIRKKQVSTIRPGETIGKFIEVQSKQVEAMTRFSQISTNLEYGRAQLQKRSALETGLEPDSIDLVVTSPPYINAVDYPRTHQLEMYWLGFIDGSPLSDLKRQYIGTETVYKSEYERLQCSGHENLDEILEEIYNQDPRRSYIVYRYFEEMTQQFKETHRILKHGSRYCVVIGSNTIRGVPVPSYEILTEIATKLGFEIEKRFFSGLIRHFIKIPRKERMKGEWVIVLRKP